MQDFQHLQFAFTQHIRDPKNHLRPKDVNAKRMQVYCELLYNNVEDFIAGGFPVLRSILDDTTWESMIRDYFKQHRSHSPLFRDIPAEFLDYLENERDSSKDLPFILELAHYEWVELALDISNELIDWKKIRKRSNLLQNVPIISPLAWLLEYQFPVHKIGMDYQPSIPPPQPTYLVVYRNQKDNVNFMELNPITARLIALLSEEKDITGTEAILQIANELQHPHPEVMIGAGEDMLKNLRKEEIILGAKII